MPMKRPKTNSRRKNKVSSEKAIKENKKISRNKVLLIIICIFVSVVILFGATLGIVLGVRNSRADVRFNGVRISEGETSFLLSKYKRDFLIKHHGYDSDTFWSSKYDSEHTYAELLREESERYLREIAIMNYLFDTVDGIEFSGLDEIAVRRAVKEVLDYRDSYGSEEKFNEIAEKYGFDFEDFSSAVVLLYKASVLQARIFGSDGSGVKNYTADCQSYLDGNYSHVKLLFIRTEDKFELDSQGNRVKDENGQDKKIPLSDSEKAQRAALIQDIEDKISAYEGKSDGVQMTPVHFKALLTEHGEGDPSRNDNGYYFSLYSSFSNEFTKNPDGSTNEKRLEIVKCALTMENGYAKRDFDGGVCFIYKYENTSGAYADTSDACFSDFYSLCADATFNATVAEFLGEVKIKDRVFSRDLTEMPADNPFVPKFEL